MRSVAKILLVPQHTLVDFHRMMTKLVEMEDSQYSYKNTLVAMSTDGILVGILVAYDGADVKDYVSALLRLQSWLLE